MTKRKRKLPIRREPEPQAEAERDGDERDGDERVGDDRDERVGDDGVVEDVANDGVADEIAEDEGGESSHDSSVNEDDCPVIVEDTSGYREVEPCLAENPEEDEDDFVDVEICENIEELFGHVAGEDDESGNKSDDSGDDIWDDEKIPDPLSDDDDEYEAERPFTHGDNADDLLALNKTFNNAEEPLLGFLTEVRRKCMERNAKRTLLTNRWKKRFTPRADREIELNRQKAKDCRRYMTTGSF